ncbi:MAG: TlpA family protein disulfide reductase [Burkholderiaceae bacterium]|nr:TlpA family protein disulfide reductase [Burkholderiaceae bacterium]
MTLRSLVAGALLALSLPVAAVQVGGAAPEFDLPGSSGAVKLSALRGKVVYLDIWASWCGPCRQSFPWLNEMQAKYGAQGLTVVGVNVDAKRSDAEAFLKEVPAQFTIAFDPKGDTPARYAAKGMPTSYLIGRDGKVLATHVGFRPEEKAALEAQIRQALGLK